MTQPVPPASTALPPAIVSTVRDAVMDFITGSCNPPAATSPAAPQSGAAIMGVISFFGDPAWSFALVLPEETAVAAAHGFAGFDIPFSSPDMGDLVGEMANVVAGDVVARLDAGGIKAQMSLPTVARGHAVELLPPSRAAEVRLDLSAPVGNFQLRLFQAVVGAPAGYTPPGF